MQYRTMGASDLEISAIGFGCWEMGGNQYGDVDDQEEIRAVHRAIDLGVTLFDTAAIYGHGHSEEVLGKALGARRKEIVLVTKGGLSWEVAGGPQWRDSSRAAITRGMDESLKRLGTDYVDLYLIHWPDVKTPIDETMETLNDLVRSGKTRFIGVSNYSAAQLREAKRTANICANQVGYNLFDRRWEREMFSTARDLGIGVMAYGPMAHGLLTGTFTTETTFVEWDWRSRGVAFGQQLFAAENFPQERRGGGPTQRSRRSPRHDTAATRHRLGFAATGGQRRARRHPQAGGDRAERRRARHPLLAGRPQRDRRNHDRRGGPGGHDSCLIADQWMHSALFWAVLPRRNPSL